MPPNTAQDSRSFSHLLQVPTSLTSTYSPLSHRSPTGFHLFSHFLTRASLILCPLSHRERPPLFLFRIDIFSSSLMLSCEPHLKLKYQISRLFDLVCLPVLSCSLCVCPASALVFPLFLPIPLYLHFRCLSGRYLYAAAIHLPCHLQFLHPQS